MRIRLLIALSVIMIWSSPVLSTKYDAVISFTRNASLDGSKEALHAQSVASIFNNI